MIVIESANIKCQKNINEIIIFKNLILPKFNYSKLIIVIIFIYLAYTEL